MSSSSSSTTTTGPPGTGSLSALLTTLVPVALLALVYVTIFLVLRRSQRRFYQPRTFLPSLRPQERSPDMPNGLINWFGAFFSIPDSYVLNHHSLDAFLLLRYLKIATMLCFVGCCMTWPVLFPVNATDKGGSAELSILAIGNIKNNKRLYAHTFVAWIYFSFVFYTIARESIYYINLRQAYLLSPLYASRMSSRTVLFTSVPAEYLDETRIRRMFGKQLKNLWIASDCKELEKKVEERDKVAYKLEAAETKLVKLANKAHAKSIKKGTSHHEEEHLGNTGEVDRESGSAAARWIDPKQRPTHRTKFLIGKKVDTINWCRSELERLIPEVEALQAKHRNGEAKFVGSVFVEFYTQSDAQAAYQMVAHHQALHMSPRFIGVNPDQIIWKNLRIKWWERVIRNITTITFVILLVIFWAIPVAFVGILSNINSLLQIAPWLDFLRKLPSVVFGLVSGLLPTILLAVLMALLPIVLRLMAKLGGLPTLARVELRTQNFYFLFQIIQVFLVVTLASAATSTASQIAKDPSSAVSLLAQRLPLASNFYVSYFVLQGLTISSGALAQVVGLILFRVLGKILDSTPRKMYKRWSSLSSLGWGTLLPIYTNLTVIAITYSIISPLVLGFAAIGLWLIYFMHRYNTLFVNDCVIDTQGLIYPRALQQTTTGVYLAILCLIGLFGINKAPGPAILMAVFLVFIILFHVSLNAAIDPLLVYLPRSLESEEESLLALEDGNASGNTIQDEKYNHNTGHAPSNGDTGAAATDKSLPAAPHKKPNFITKWLRPDKFTDYQTLRRLVPRGFADIAYAPEIERSAYYHPAIASQPPVLWIPRDSMGVSRQEVGHTNNVIPISDEGAGFDDKGGMHIVEDDRPPIYKEKIYW